MPDIWFIADTHFFHEGMLKFTDQNGQRIRHQFDNINQMNEAIISNWNSVVKPSDKIYHLGDVTFKYGKQLNELMSRLNGHKRLIVGNHDEGKEHTLTQWFEKISCWRLFKLEDMYLTATHVPIHSDSLMTKKLPGFNVHGHLHKKQVADKRYHCVSVENINYTPIHMDEVQQIFRQRKY